MAYFDFLANLSIDLTYYILYLIDRSVQLLRTTFQDHPVWKPLMKILGSPASSCDFMVVASSTLCNLLLEFSPSKEPILELGAIDLLCSLTHKYEPALVLNGVWGLMVSMIRDIEMRMNLNNFYQCVGIF